MVDLFEQAGITVHPSTTKGSGGKSGGTRLMPSRQLQHDDSGEESYGGHNLRTTIPIKTRDATGRITHRPRSALATRSHPLRQQEEQEEEEEEEREDDGESNPGNSIEDGDDMEQSDDGNEVIMDGTEASTRSVPDPMEPTNTSPPHSVQPFHLTRVQDDSALGQLARTLFATPSFNLTEELAWQAAVAGDTSKQKSFRHEVAQIMDLVAFGFMRPSSPYIQILHSVATFAARGGNSEFHNKDFGFVGDRTQLRTPSPVLLDDKMWKWIGKKVTADVGPLEVFYSNPANRRVLYSETDIGATTTIVPRMAYLPPPFLVYCIESQRTPFQLHNFITAYATRDGSETAVEQCQMLLDWCIVAAHSTAASPATSILSVTLETAPGDEEDFLRWLQKIDVTTELPSTTQRPAKQIAPNALPVAPPPLPAPPEDIWKSMAESISKSFATAAAAIKPPTDDSGTSYEDGGLKYDEFQLAIVQGFAHVDNIMEVPIIWALFQYTKNIDTHKDNLKRKMMEWATSTDRPEHVQIDRSLYIPHTTMREILSLTFNPGGVAAESDTADQGISIMICRPRTSAQKAEIRKFERAAEKSKKNWSMAEAAEQSTAYDMGALPDDYNELLRTLGTYCALLHALFGKKCLLYRQCYHLWTTMNSNLVYEKREKFDALRCRQIVWAIVEESRVYFSKRLSVDDFKNATYPEDIPYPTCSLSTVIQAVRDITPIERGSFPSTWMPGRQLRAGLAGGTVATSSGPAPVQSVTATMAGAPSVVSGITAGSGSTRTQHQPVTIWPTNVHPTLKAAMEPYILKCKGVNLTQMLNHVNLTIDDLPKLAPEVSGENGVCYNFVLGRCTIDSCRHRDGHVNARDVTDEFATELLTLLRPAITEFTANGLPASARRRNRRRRRE